LWKTDGSPFEPHPAASVHFNAPLLYPQEPISPTRHPPEEKSGLRLKQDAGSLILRFMKTPLLLVALLYLTTGVSCADPVRIVCLGDSLTTCGGQNGRYTDWLAQWLPRCEIINKGVGGDTLAQGRTRYQRDVLDLQPDIVVIQLGANDFWRAQRPIGDLAADLEYMVKLARHTGIQVVIASCFGNDTGGDPSEELVNRRQQHYGNGIAAFERRICERYGCFYVPNLQVDIKPIKSHPEFWGDHRHPNKAGNQKVALRILTELKKAMAARP
jgi:lysophospholipase L1-like esterase